jgi:hypothetical protein
MTRGRVSCHFFPVVWQTEGGNCVTSRGRGRANPTHTPHRFPRGKQSDDIAVTRMRGGGSCENKEKESRTQNTKKTDAHTLEPRWWRIAQMAGRMVWATVMNGCSYKNVVANDPTPPSIVPFTALPMFQGTTPVLSRLLLVK